MSRQDVDPKIWGPHTWKFVESVYHSFPSIPSSEWGQEDLDTVTNIATFFQTLSSVLPCQKCREDYKKFLETYPIENSLNDSEDLWLWIFHLRKNMNPNLAKLVHLSPGLTLQQSKAYFQLPHQVQTPSLPPPPPPRPPASLPPLHGNNGQNGNFINSNVPSNSNFLRPHPLLVVNPPPAGTARTRTLGSRMGMPNLKFKPTRGCNCGGKR